MTKRNPCIALALAPLLLALAVTSAAAQNYPSRPVKLIMPYAPGGIEFEYVLVVVRGSPLHPGFYGGGGEVGEQVRGQLDTAITNQGQGDLQKLLHSGETWVIN